MHAPPFAREHAQGGQAVKKRLHVPEHVLIPILPDDAVAVEVVQVDGDAGEVQHKGAEQLEAGKAPGF